MCLHQAIHFCRKSLNRRQYLFTLKNHPPHKGKVGEITLQIDISKAFETYLFGVLNKMDFHEKRINWIKLYFQFV